MAISNVKLEVSNPNPKIGDSVKFTVTWIGSPNSLKYGVADKVAFRGYGDFIEFPTATVHSGKNTASFYTTINSSMFGIKTGGFVVTHYSISNDVTSVESTDEITLAIDHPDIDFQVTLSPANSSIKAGETTVFTPTITGVEPPFSASYKWYYETSPTPDTGAVFSKTWDTPGHKQVLCDVTVTKDGYNSKTVQGSTSLTMTTGSLEEDIAIYISGIRPNYRIFDNLEAMASVVGLPENAIISYQWEIDGVKVADTTSLSHMLMSVGHHRVQLICSVHTPDYKGITVESPVFPIIVNKIPANELNVTIPDLALALQHWGPNGRLLIYAHASLDTPDGSSVVINVDKSKPAVFKIDGNLVGTSFGPNPSHVVATKYYMPPSFVGNHNASATFSVEETEYTESGQVSGTSTFNIDKIRYSGYSFVINGILYSNRYPFYIKALPGEQFQISVENWFSDLVHATPEYATELKALGKKGIFELTDQNGNVVATAVNNIITYTVPSESNTLKGKIRHTLNDGALFDLNPYQTEMTVEFTFVSNPMEPFPKCSIVQTPNPVRLGQPVKYTVAFSDLPENTNIDDSKWFINDTEVGNGAELNRTASSGNIKIRNSTLAIPIEFDQALLGAEYTPNILKKPWPEITLGLLPARTSIPWGEFLISEYDIIGRDLIEDDFKLVAHTPLWFLDNKPLDTLAPDGTLNIRALTPGQHTVKSIITLEHPDYENEKLDIEKSFNITMEPRIMDTTVELTPLDPSIKLGDKQRFTATVTVTPETPDAVTTYQWFVDDSEQTGFTENYMEYTATEVGTKTVKVITTTSASGTDDVVKESTTTVVVTKLSQTTTVSIAPESQEIELCENYTIAVTVTGAPDEASISYLWTDGTTSDVIERTSSEVGEQIYSCTVTVTHPDYEDLVTTTSARVITTDSAPVIPDSCEIQYVHPLPQRNSAYIWAGWWIMDEIEKIAKSGGDWKKPQPGNKYECHLATLAKMLYDFPEVDVQESRHGRIVHRSALDIGIIY
ncbi:head outer capsid protein [Acinetobacter phage vB_AbaM_PhT2]|uniref:Highly immunogenic outer capsid protein n=1 Tax=Acinetobacter phage vB_AbaM_PhT2 TaxID=2690230 RepID=A0A6B9SXZ2_9CAUD|nr:Hoc-like head decoration [Acinetobacter phage vB_AbaM_PhT2]QHJ75759.1 head outer capsid protein [Acinetobacter phage vB_AbaM_PhT2]